MYIGRKGRNPYGLHSRAERLGCIRSNIDARDTEEKNRRHAHAAGDLYWALAASATAAGGDALQSEDDDLLPRVNPTLVDLRTMMLSDYGFSRRWRCWCLSGSHGQRRDLSQGAAALKTLNRTGAAFTGGAALAIASRSS